MGVHLMPTATQWSKLNEYLLQVCTVHEPLAFCREALRLLPKLVGFDQGIVYFLDEDGEVYDTYSIGVDRQIIRAYREISLDSGCGEEGSEYSVQERARRFAEKWRVRSEKSSVWAGYPRTPSARRTLPRSTIGRASTASACDRGDPIQHRIRLL